MRSNRVAVFPPIANDLRCFVQRPEPVLVQGAGERLKSAGKVMSPARLEIRRPDNTIREPGEIGEIICFSDRLMDEYWHRREDTEKVLTQDGYKSGDAGYLDEEGYLFVSTV